MKRVNKHLDAINIFSENRSRIKSRNWKQSLCRSKSVFFCVSIRSNLPEEDIFASFSCLWNRPIGLTNTSQVGIKAKFLKGRGSCYVAIRNASKDPGGIRKSLTVVISKTSVPESVPLLEQKGAGRRVLITFLLTVQGWVNPQSISESLLKSHQQMKSFEASPTPQFIQPAA